MTCPQEGGFACPDRDCPGRRDPGVCRHLARLQAWRSLSADQQAWRIRAGRGGFEPSREPAGGRLRVGLLCPCLGLGGAEVWQLALARAVDPDLISWRGVAVTDGRGSTDPAMEAELGSFMPVGHGLDAARALAAACDVVVSWSVTSVPDLLAGLDSPPSVVVACHFPAESPWGPGTEALFAGVDRFVAVSELAVDSAPPSLRNRIDVIWNGVDARRLEVRRDRKTMRASWQVPEGAPVAGFVGRLSPEKDPDAMIRMARGLPDPWQVVVVGDGRERPALDAQARVSGLGRVHLVGGDPAVGDVLNAVDALVVPSRFESFGLTLAEGLWAGVPVVATRSGLAKLVPGLVREIDVGAGTKDLVDAVLADWSNLGETRSRVDRARTFARARLGLDRFGHDWTEMLVRAAAGREGGRPCRSTNRVA